MAAIRFKIWWSVTSCEIIACDIGRTMADVIEMIRQRVGVSLPEEDSMGHLIEYALYKEEQAQRVAFPRRISIQRAGIQPDDQIFLANRKEPWWRRVPVLQECRVQLASGCIITVPRKGLLLSRNYLLQALPRAVVAWENARILVGHHSRLMRVTRERHCDIYAENDRWMLRASKPTYVDGKAVNKNTPVVIARTTEIVLGHDGWPIQVTIEVAEPMSRERQA